MKLYSSHGQTMGPCTRGLVVSLSLFRLTLVSIAFLQLANPSATMAQDKPSLATPPAAPPHIVAEAPTAIESATLVIEAVSKPQTVQFKDTSISEVADWIRDKTGLNVVMDNRSLEAAGILSSEPINDSLNAAPMYLLLDRLANQKIQWSAAGGIITLYAAKDQRAVYAVQYNVGELLDTKFKGDTLVGAIESTIDPESWSAGNASAVLLGDILFLRQSARNHRLVAGMLTALKSPSRRIVIDQPKEHDTLRTQLAQVISIDAKDKPLSAVVTQLAELAKIDLRLNRAALSTALIAERLPVTIQITNQKLSAVLDILTTQYSLAWHMRDGAVWVTTAGDITEHPSVAVYDVRDLCLNMDESLSLQVAIEQQAMPASWETGVMTFAKSGVMVVRQTEANQSAVLGLLDDYRLALKNSKRRISPEEDPEVVEIKYYRMPTAVAEDLITELPTLVAPITWKSDAQPTGVGTIRKLRSWDQAARPGTKDATNESSISYSVLVIEQRRKVHREISKTLDRIERGDMPEVQGGMGGMGGGFGGGMF